MARIPKSEAYAALERAGQNLVNARGGNAVASRKEIETMLAGLGDATERALTDQFHRFIEQRDAAPGARLTAADVQRALAYAKEHLIAKYDLNDNGLSKAEIGQMSRLGQLAVEYATKLRKPADAPPPAGLAAGFAAAAKDTYYMSESDYQPELVSAPLPAGSAVNGDTVMAALGPKLERFFEGSHEPGTRYVAETWSVDEGRELLHDLTVPNDAGDEYLRKNAEGFARLNALLDANLTDVRVIKVGPKDDASDALASDHGLYAYLVVGKTPEGGLAGMLFGSVET